LIPQITSAIRSINTIFGKVGSKASEEVILHLVKTKCLPILLYGLECYPLNKADTNLSILQSQVFWWKCLELWTWMWLMSVVYTLTSCCWSRERAEML